jgi:hypothetical protein
MTGAHRRSGREGWEIENPCAPLDADAKFPKTIDGVPIRVELVGPIRKR